VYISLLSSKERIVFILPLKEGYEVIKMIQERNSSMDDQNMDFVGTLIDENLKLM